MCNYYLIFTIFVIIFGGPVMSSWEFAVSMQKEINFYASDWKELMSAGHQFKKISAIAFDETKEIIYFNDRDHKNGTIFSLKLSDGMNHRIETIVQKTKDENVLGIAFDPLERMLYWTDSKNRIIYKKNVDSEDGTSEFKKLGEHESPFGIAIDVCRRTLYWTNANFEKPSIERISLDGSEHKILFDTQLHMPKGIVVDQYSKRIFWVDDLEGDHYSVESATLDGTSRMNISRGSGQTPYDLATDETHVYWTDGKEDAAYSVSKDAIESDRPTSLKHFTLEPNGIVTRNHFFSSPTKHDECESVLNSLRSKNTTASSTSTSNAMSNITLEHFCLNNGSINPNTSKCICHAEFEGVHCEIRICHNYCIEGECIISSTGFPKCKCKPGFVGERCETDLCTGYCLNGGQCQKENDQPNCVCRPSFSGQHCETMNRNELCTNYCNNNETFIAPIAIDLDALCNSCVEKNGTFATDGTFKMGFIDRGACKESVINKTAIFVTCGVVISLALVLVIVCTVRRVYKRPRPSIKKTFFVNKSARTTPLTCRPTTEQCEITIENCCNMTICETPCFDPKMLQTEERKAEDKKTLLNNCEDLMY